MAGHHERPNWVYFIQMTPNGPIKIGESHRPAARFDAIRVGTPFQLEPLLLVRCQGKTELVLHRRFAALAIQYEWFRPGPPLLDFIADLRAQGGPCKRIGRFMVPTFLGDLAPWVDVWHPSLLTPSVELTAQETRDILATCLPDGTIKPIRKRGRPSEIGKKQSA